MIEAASWRLASELFRRHPDKYRLIRGHPGGGQYDVLWLLPLHKGGGEIRLNRNGTIQVEGTYDGRPSEPWRPTAWNEYLEANPFEFVKRIEQAAGLASPTNAPASTPQSLTYRILAAIAVSGFKTLRPIEVQLAFIDSSGMGGGSNEHIDAFGIERHRMEPAADSYFGTALYEFWIVTAQHKPILAIDQRDTTVWFANGLAPVNGFVLYKARNRDVSWTAAELQARGMTTPK